MKVRQWRARAPSMIDQAQVLGHDRHHGAYRRWHAEARRWSAASKPSMPKGSGSTSCQVVPGASGSSLPSFSQARVPYAQIGLLTLSVGPAPGATPDLVATAALALEPGAAAVLVVEARLGLDGDGGRWGPGRWARRRRVARGRGRWGRSASSEGSSRRSDWSLTTATKTKAMPTTSVSSAARPAVAQDARRSSGLTPSRRCTSPTMLKKAIEKSARMPA